MSAARPDPALGIFETLLVVDGEPVEIDAHLARMSASARELFGDAAEARTRGAARALAVARARGLGGGASTLGRLRLTLAPDGQGGLDLSADAAEVDSALVFPGPARAPALAPVTIPGGLGPHKWADRRLLERAAEAAGGDTVPLIVDADGAVLEAERANVFAVLDRVLVTPPADGRILPGITRARASEVARGLGLEVREAGLSLEALRSADEVFLTGSVRGIEPVRTAGAPSVTERLATELRERWLAPDSVS